MPESRTRGATGSGRKALPVGVIYLLTFGPDSREATYGRMLKHVAQPMQGALPQARVSVPHPYLALMGLYLGGFTGMYSETALNIALPQLSATFGVELSLVQWLVVGYMLAIGIVLPFSSLLMKWFSARKITLFALGAFLVGSVISGLSSTFGICLAGRIIQGVGTGLVLPLMFAMVLEVIPPHKIGAAMGINALVIMSASAVGPTIAGFLIGAISWNAVFFSFAVVLAIGIAFTLKFQVNPYELTKPAIDLVSVITSVLGFGGVVLGVGMASLFGWGSAAVIAALVVGIVSLVVYSRRQLSMETPVIDLRVFTIPGFRTGALCVMLNFGITLAAMYVLPQFYQNSMLLAVSLAGLVMLPGGIVNAFVSMMAGRVYDKIGARIPALAGFALSIVACALLLTTGPATPLPFVMACHILLMIGVPLAMSPSQTHALSSLPHNLSTDGSTMINTMQQVMGAIATALATYLVATGSAASGQADAAASFAAGSHWGFAFTLVMALIAFVLALSFKKRGAAEAGAAAGASDAAPKRTQGTKPADAAGTAAADANAAPGNPLASLMKTDVFVLNEEDSALEALRLFASKGISGAPVVSKAGKLVGFVSDGDIIGSLARQTPTFTSFYAYTAEGDDEAFDEKAKLLASMPVSRVATKNVLTVSVDDDMREVCSKLAMHHLKKAPVMKGDVMVGIINRSDITHYTVNLYMNA